MTNIFTTPEKLSLRTRLFQIAEDVLRADGWTVERIPRAGKASLRRITKDDIQKTVTIRTSQDTWVAFPRSPADDGWSTLDDAHLVVASSVDDPHNPLFAQVHVIDAEEMRERFDRAYEARKKAGYSMTVGRGIWLSLYEKESANPVTLVGAGAGLEHPAIAKVPLTAEEVAEVAEVEQDPEPEAEGKTMDEAPLTIAEAKRRLAQTFGVKEEDVKIIING